MSWLTSDDIEKANRKHDKAHGHFVDWWSGNVGYGFREARMFQGRHLTDRAIEKYQRVPTRSTQKPW